MKKIVIIVVIVIVVAAIGFVVYNQTHNQDKGNETQMVNYIQNGISFSYPSSWVVCESSSNYSIAAIALSGSEDSNHSAKVNINFEKKNFTGDFDSFLNSTYSSLSSDNSYNITSSGSVKIGNQNATLYEYSSSINGTNKLHKAVWFEHNNDAYVVLYSAPVDSFNQYEQIFEYVLSTFKITN